MESWFTEQLNALESRIDAKMAASEARILTAIRANAGVSAAPPENSSVVQRAPPDFRMLSQESAEDSGNDTTSSSSSEVGDIIICDLGDEDDGKTLETKTSPPVQVLRTKSHNANIKQLALVAQDQLVASSAKGGVAGVIMSQGCIDQFDKTRRGRNNIRWASFGWDPLGSGWLVPIEEADGTDDLLGDWQSFVANLPDTTPLFCLYNFTYIEGAGMSSYGAKRKTSMCLFTWMPDKIQGIAGTRLKMKVSTTVATVKSGFKGISHDKIIRDKDMLDWSSITDKISLKGALYE
jgi:hypothetical protein